MRSLLFLLLVSTSMVWSIQALDFYVGGNNGWVLNPTESFNQWAGKNKFHIHDNLVFKYKKGDDTVLEVTKENYLTCNTSNFISRMGSGDSWFELERTGAFFFISGSPCHCKNGQKMVVVVVVDDGSGQATSPQVAPSPSPLPKVLPPSSPSSSSSPSPLSSMVPSPSGVDESPSAAPGSESMESHHGPAPSPSVSGSLKVMMIEPMVMVMGLVLGGLFI